MLSRNRIAVEAGGFSSRRLARAAALVFAMVFPSIATWLYFMAYAGHPAMRLVYSIGKVVQFSFPLVWLLAVERRWPRLFRGGGRGGGVGVAFGGGVGWVVSLSGLGR